MNSPTVLNCICFGVLLIVNVIGWTMLLAPLFGHQLIPSMSKRSSEALDKLANAAVILNHSLVASPSPQSATALSQSPSACRPPSPPPTLLPPAHASERSPPPFTSSSPPPIDHSRNATERTTPKHYEMSSSTSCDSQTTVAYAFLVRSSLPLWDAWTEYWDGCEPGTIVPVVHSQAVGAERAALASLLEQYGGRLTDQTLNGNPRWQWLMMRMMFLVYRTAAHTIAPNGCKPQWIHLATEADLPVRSCNEVHTFIAQHPGYSYINQMQDAQDSGPWTWEVDQEIRPAAHTSTWMTLATPHALALAHDEGMLHNKWEPHLNGWTSMLVEDENVWGTADEFIFYTELSQRGFPFIHRGLTAAWICCIDTDHPDTALNRVAAKDLCHRAQREGFFFVRKFGQTTATVLAGWRDCMQDPRAALLHCDNSKCNSFGNDCCAPYSLEEAATCADGYTPVRKVQDCFGLGLGLYSCCK